MAARSGIEWTESTWNPVTGCSKISPGCAHCYAERMARRLQAMGQANYVNGFEVTVHERSLDLPLRWRRPQMVFVNSMSDLFHEEVPTDFILRIFDVMREADRHVFQVLTKRSARLLELSPLLPSAPHIWLGVTVENQDYWHRVGHLRATGACVRFVSLEPLLGPMPNMDLSGIHWVIVGGESGPGARPMPKEWVVAIREQCLREGVPFFFKQWGGTFKKREGRRLDGRLWNGMPALPGHSSAWQGAGAAQAQSLL